MLEHLPGDWAHTFTLRPKLLIADDQPVNVRALHALFKDDCDVFMATNGAQTLDLCRKVMPDLILLDVVMDGMDGHEVCRRLKADPLTHTIPIIFVTAQTDEADEEHGLSLGAVDFITKPIKPAIVRARVRAHLSLKMQGDVLRSIALVDGLTGVGNRRKFEEDLDTSWRHCLRETMPLSLVMVDVDYFKRYNDRYGHQAGDRCLQTVAKRLTQMLRRPYDTVGRYGGEEFACLLPNTPLEAATRIALGMEEGVRALTLEHLDSGCAETVTISAGVATLIPTAEISPAELLEAADQQLYEAKHAGRARVASALKSLTG
ncbi:diguanylate cyclase [Paraburkholderia bengalensis]|uniref:diguanylate cyclase n=1 Tax=Paraburkholderia bengalensis TaxID=2747562 RepID=A0ABU8IM18_9BURK